ncbi:hypothetical protein HRM2_17890 [Desulforapulum autotrophicum HRM2]|uniref:Uncharacterized protein n=1 Tax=Desulforapulum autotrophicum (strain ATCC 43914 / DSM 3382 / VKM B-1955 / HRM2) TaxID=177437 RepID=C0QB94_DESAH|nr:hypothetical protein HRM2_17890 [Desulforapulum autotrophicum HRM2]
MVLSRLKITKEKSFNNQGENVNHTTLDCKQHLVLILKCVEICRNLKVANSHQGFQQGTGI